jgi:hypothetical protein
MKTILNSFVKSGLLVATVGLVAGCSQATEEPTTGPRIQSLDKESYAIGEVMEATGKGFLNGEDGRTFIQFKGTFTDDEGVTTEVDFEAPAFFQEDEEGGETLKWPRFGPFANPFVDGGHTGTFNGEILPINRYDDGRETVGSTKVKSVKVDPSLEIVELQPVWADCGMPAMNGFGGTPYRIKVRAAGFVPDQFDYRISGLANPDAEDPADQPSIKEFVEFGHEATGRTDVLDEEDQIVFLPPPQDTKYYVANIQVRARDAASGKYVDTYLPFEIHRPIEVTYSGNYEVAETYEPKPVSACIPGAIGNRATYSETETEVRQQTVSVSFTNSFVEENGISTTENWQEGYGTTEGVSRTEGGSSTYTNTETSSLTNTQNYNESDTNTLNHSTTDAENWSSSDKVGATVGAEGSAGIPLVAEGKVSAEARYDRTWARGGSTANTRNFGEAHTTSRGKSISGTYTLSESNSETSSYSDTQSRENSRTYNFGAAATEEQRISQGITESEEETWMRSESHSTLTSYSGFIPVDRFGVFYRQTIRMVRRANVISYNACGVGEPVGQIYMNEWNWAPDLAVGDSCDAALPETNLPPAKCHIPPCE